MASYRFLIAAALVGTLALPLTAVQAQQTQKDSFGNKSVAGVCMLSRGAVLTDSKVGQVASTRLKQLAQQANGQLQAKSKPLDADVKKFRAGAKGMTEANRESQQKALQQRMQSLQRQAQQMKARVQITRSDVTKRIAAQLDPLVANVYKQRGCGILLDRDDVLGGNNRNDLTAAAISALNQKMSTISFNLSPLPKQQSSGK